MVHHDTPLDNFVRSLSGRDAALREQVAPQIGRLQRDLYFITVGDLWGSLHPEMPTTPQDGGRCLAKSFLKTPGLQSVEQKTANLAKALGVSLETTRRLVKALEAVPKPLNKVRPADSEWYLGAQKKESSQKR